MVCGRLGVAMEVVDVVMSEFVVLELSDVDGVVVEVVFCAHAVISTSTPAGEASSEGEDGREQSSMKRERRWGAIGVTMVIVDV